MYTVSARQQQQFNFSAFNTIENRHKYYCSQVNSTQTDKQLQKLRNIAMHGHLIKSLAAYARIDGSPHGNAIQVRLADLPHRCEAQAQRQ